MEKVDIAIEKLLQKYLEFIESANEFADAFKEAYHSEGMAAIDITFQKLRKHACEKLKSNPYEHPILADIEYMIAKLNSELTAGATKIKCPKCKTEPLFTSALPGLYKCRKCGTTYQIERCPTCPHTTYTIKELKTA
ncbi:MAG: hypothetical protein QXJ07_04895 [Candidatus Bathyarchaeia archaeon]